MTPSVSQTMALNMAVWNSAEFVDTFGTYGDANRIAATNWARTRHAAKVCVWYLRQFKTIHMSKLERIGFTPCCKDSCSLAISL